MTISLKLKDQNKSSHNNIKIFFISNYNSVQYKVNVLLFIENMKNSYKEPIGIQKKYMSIKSGEKP